MMHSFGCLKQLQTPARSCCALSIRRVKMRSRGALPMVISVGAGKCLSPKRKGLPVTRMVCKPSSNVMDNDLEIVS